MKVAETIAGVAISCAVGMAAFAMKFQFDAAQRLAVIETQLQEIVDSADEHNEDTHQNATLSKHWRIVSQHREAINELRRAAGLPIIRWD